MAKHTDRGWFTDPRGVRRDRRHRAGPAGGPLGGRERVAAEGPL